MTTNYVSLKAVLYDLSLVLDDRYYNESIMLEWAAKGYRKLNLPANLVSKSIRLEIKNHKTTLPSDFRYLVQIAQYITKSPQTISVDQDLPSTTLSATRITSLPWKPMRLSSNPFHDAICLDESIKGCTDCSDEFSISPDLVLTSTLCNGLIHVAYLAWATDEEGLLLIPDNEDVKQAVLYYVLYMYWLSKDLMKEDGADNRMQKYLQLWQTALMKAKNVTLPDINQLENIKADWNRLIPRENKFAQFFTTLGNRESTNF